MAAKSSRLQAVFARGVHTLDQLPKDGRPQIAVGGRSNVGKSSLMNTIFARKSLVKVSATPGKTRALNFFLVNDLFYVVDLPGYGYAKASKDDQATWKALIESYFQSCKDIAGVALLLDARHDPSAADLQMISWLAERELPAMIVLTKTDKLNRQQVKVREAALERELNTGVLPFSSVTGLGKLELRRALLDLVAEFKPKGRQKKERAVHV